MIDLHTDIACRAFTLELSHGCVLRVCYDGTAFHAQIHLGNLSQRINACLEIAFLAFQHNIGVGSKWHVAECGNKNRLRLVVRVSDDSVRTLNEVAEKSTFEEGFLHLFCIERINLLLAEVNVLLGGSGFNLNA